MADLGFANISASGRGNAPVSVNPLTGSFGSSKSQDLSGSPAAASTGHPATSTTPGNATDGFSSSPTVLSSADITDNTIPLITQKLGSYTPPPQPVQTGSGTTSTQNSGGTAAPSPADDPDGTKAILAEYGLGGTTAADIETSIQNDPTYKDLMTLQTAAKASNDAALNTTIGSITQKYSALNANLVASQTSQSKGMENLLILGGAVHTPSETTAMTAKNAYDISTIQTLQDEENQALAAARQAHDANDLQRAQTLLDNVEKIRAQKQDVAAKVNASITAQLQAQNKAKLQSARDNAVAGAIAKGITDPAKILETLNANSTQYGSPFTAAEIQSTIKNLAPNDTYKELSGNVKDFYELQNLGKLPAGVTDLKGYLAYIKPATAGKAGTKITLSTAKTQKLPLSTVGMTEQDLANSFNSETPPQWFGEKLSMDNGGASTTEENLQSQWDAYKQAYESARDSSSSGGP